jgi:hypothetical protein
LREKVPAEWQADEGSRPASPNPSSVRLRLPPSPAWGEGKTDKI